MLLNFVTLRAQAAGACLAMCIASNPSFRQMLDHLWTMVESQDSNQLIVSALTIGEYGKIVDLSTEARHLPTVQRLFAHQ